MKVAIIPARGGSKRIPRKNIEDFCGKPMIAWSIKAAIASECFDRVLVSTDDKEIAAVAREQGAETPFIRPADLSNDYAGTLPVIRHAIEQLEEQGASIESACCLYATAPFTRPEDLQRGLEILDTEKCSYAFSVTSFPFPIQRAVRMTENIRIEMFSPEFMNTRSQDLEEAYHDAGQFYWGTALAWKREEPIFTVNSAAVVLPRERVQDIDTQEDWNRAEWLFKAMQSKV